MKKNKNFRKIPSYIERSVENVTSRYGVVATVLDINEHSVKEGKYRHLGMRLDGNTLLFSNEIRPNRLKGVYARRNLRGYSIVHKHLPKIPKSYTWEVPNFGDPEKGYHDICVTRLVYPRSYVAPKEWGLKIDLLDERTLSDKTKLFKVKVSVDTVLDKKSSSFKKDLFFAINLLQESAHSCDFFDAGMTDDEYRRITYVGWKIFPEGSLERAISFACHDFKERKIEIEPKQIQDRIDFLDRLKPIEYIVGYGINRGYIGAKFSENLVVFENVEYGNAIYVLFDNWMELSKMSRIDILQRKEKDFMRLAHRKNWKVKLAKIVKQTTINRGSK